MGRNGMWRDPTELNREKRKKSDMQKVGMYNNG